MRSLRRAPHQRLPGSANAGTVASFQAAELGTIKRRERIGILRLLTLGAFLLAVAALLAWSAHGRIVAEGLIEANLVEVRAPGRVRVKEVFCTPGQALRRGDPLFLFEALGTSGERRALELDLQHVGLRLALAEAGADLGEVDLDRRIAASEDAEREWKLTDADIEVAQAELEVLRRRREKVSASAAVLVHELASGAEVLAARVAEVALLAERAAIEEGLAEFDLRSRRALSSLGAVSAREQLGAEASREKSASEVESHRASSRTLNLQAEHLRAARALEEQRTTSTLAELDAEIDGALAEIEALRTRRDLWRSATLRKRVLAPEGSEQAGRLRGLELGLLRTEVESAEARLADFDRRVGHGLARAETDGVCDQVLAAPGAVAAAGELLATHYDPRTRRVVAYVGPGAAERLALGQSCSVTPLKGETSIWGRIGSSAAAWVPRPSAIPGREEPSADRRLAFRLALSEVPAHYRPGMRVAVVFARSTEQAARTAGVQ